MFCFVVKNLAENQRMDGYDNICLFCFCFLTINCQILTDFPFMFVRFLWDFIWVRYNIYINCYINIQQQHILVLFNWHKKKKKFYLCKDKIDLTVRSTTKQNTQTKKIKICLSFCFVCDGDGGHAIRHHQNQHKFHSHHPILASSN